MAKSDDIMKILLDKIQENHEEAKESFAELRRNLGSVKDDISSINLTSARQQMSLEEHMRRTEANEKALQLLEEKNHKDVESLGSRVVPLERHVAMWGGAGKLIALLATVSALAYTIYKFFN